MVLGEIPIAPTDEPGIDDNEGVMVETVIVLVTWLVVLIVIVLVEDPY